MTDREERTETALSTEGFFEGQPEAESLFDAVRDAVTHIGDADVRVSKSQVAFRRRRTFAAVWLPGMYLRGDTAPLVLAVFLPFRDPSPRWKEVVEPAPGRFTHHLELRDPADVDDEVVGWLRRAWAEATG